MTHEPCIPGLLDPESLRVVVKSPVAKEVRRLNAAASRVLARLQRGPATNVELSHPDIGGLRFGGRLFELAKQGHAVTKRHVVLGIWEYTLVPR